MVINLLLIGNGQWASKCISTLSIFKNIKIIIADKENWQHLIDKKPDGVIITTQPQKHIEIAKYALSNNIPAFIEKPLSLSLKEAEELKNYNIPILVNHIHLFSNAYQKLKNIINIDKIDKILSLGFNNGPIRNYSSLYDYGPHDLSLILDISQQLPKIVDCQEVQTKNGSLFKINLNFDRFVSESLVGNGGSKKVRKFKIESEGLKLIIDDLCRPDYHLPPLTNAFNVFINAIAGKNDYRLGIDLSLKILEILEYCEISLKDKNEANKRI